MTNLTKKIFLITFFAALILICKSTIVYADEPEVLINGGTDNIYTTNIGDDAVFDKDTNTLTLNNYNGGHILFNGFDDGSEIKINIKGTNKIEEPAVEEPESSLYGIGVPRQYANKVDFTFVGEDDSSLEVNNCYNGIYTYTGDITMDNVNLKADNNYYVGVYTIYGNFDISNSKISVKNGDYGIAADVDTEIAKLTNCEITFDNIYDGIYLSGSGNNLIIKDCCFDINNISDSGIYHSSGDFCDIDNCKFNATNTDYPIYCCCSTKIENGSEITMDAIYEGIYAYDLEITDSKLDIKDAVYAISCSGTMNLNNVDLNIDNTTYTCFDCGGSIYESYAIYSYHGETNVVDSNITINNVDYGFYVEAPLIFDGGITTINANFIGIYDETYYDASESNYIEFKDGAVYINVKEEVAIVTCNMLAEDNEDIIINDNLRIVEEGLDIRKCTLEIGTLSSIGGEINPAEDTDLDILIGKMAKKVSIVPNTTVSFDGNGAEGTMADVNTFGQYTLPENGFEVPANKTFVGWSLSASGDKIITELNISEDTTVYAIWKNIEYTVTFNSNGGSAVESQTVVQNSKATQPTDPAKEKYTFDGWYSDEELTTKYDFTTAITKDITLYAKWKEGEPVKYTVTFNSNGGSAVESQTVVQNSKATQPTDPTKENYKFDSWYSDETLTTKYDFTTAITKDITLYAKWNEVKPDGYTYTFKSGDFQTFTISSIENYTFTIDGDYHKFEKLTIGTIELVRDEDYKVEEGSTIITLLKPGLDKLNKLSVGEYEVIVKYTEETVKGGLKITEKEDDGNKDDNDNGNEENNPKTGDYIIYSLIALVVAGVGLYVVSIKTKKSKNK